MTAYHHLPDHIRQAIEHALNPNQLETLQLYLEAKSMTPERGLIWMGRELGIDKKSVSDRLERARRNLHRAGIHQDLNGNWHHTTTGTSTPIVQHVIDATETEFPATTHVRLDELERKDDAA